MTKFDQLVDTVEAYEARVQENYERVKRLAQEIKDGFCGYLDAKDGVCVHLVPPAGPFKPATDVNTAFSIPPRGFRPLGPIFFGLAIRVSRGTDWIRVVFHCHKQGEKFSVHLDNGPSYTFTLPLAENDPAEFYDLVYDYVLTRFTEAIERYDRGTDARSIGFDFSDTEEENLSV